ncbi:hypothetical protein AB0J35_60905 [Nonomuraea angiospora]|uniref:hypothetical protein n=1 Tax=Nonomuraea angiospora TaxID=46172 RepID=UPI00342FD3C3
MLEQMAAPGGEAAMELGDVRVKKMTAKVFTFDENDNEIIDELRIMPPDRDGSTARWEGRRGDRVAALTDRGPQQPRDRQPGARRGHPPCTFGIHLAVKRATIPRPGAPAHS